MATLHLRNVPAEIDAALAAEAAAHGVSKNRQAITALRRGLGFDQVERSRLVATIRQQRRTVDADIAELVRGDRPDDGSPCDASSATRMVRPPSAGCARST